MSNFIHFIHLRLCVTILSLPFLCFPLLSQAPAFTFKHLNVEDGLSQSTVHVIYQDRKGFMWFGTDIGLNKYDGYKFTVYQSSVLDTTSISSNFIVAIFEDSFGKLWIGNGYNGLDLFDREKDIFIKYKHKKNDPGSISNNNIRAIFEDSHKNLWIGTSGGGLNLFNRQKNTFTHFIHDPNHPSIGSNFIRSISEDTDGNLWLGSTEGILCEFNPQKKIYKNYSLYGKYKGDLYNTTFASVYIDSENNVWFGTEIGLFVLNQKSGKFTFYKKEHAQNSLNDNAVSSILEYKKGEYLIATDHGGLNFFDSKTHAFYHYLNDRNDNTSLSNNQLYSIYRSPDGIIWIGSFHGGVNILNPQASKFQKYIYIKNDPEPINCCNSVLTINEDVQNNIWIGYDGQGIDIFNPVKHTISHMGYDPNDPNTISSNCVTEIFRDHHNNMWIGTYLEGMSEINRITKKFTHYKHNPADSNSLCGNNVWAITEDHNQILWIGTIGTGLDVFNQKKNIFIHYKNIPGDPQSLSNNDVFKVFEDQSDHLWVGTRNGLNLFHRVKGTFTRYLPDSNDKRSIFGSWIYDIYQDKNGNLWVGTDLGLNLYQPELNGFKHFTQKEGLKGSAVMGILEDSHHNLWLSTNKGLSRFNTTDQTFRNYGISDGLQGDEFNYTSALLTGDGTMYFGGTHGFNMFKPDQIKDNKLIPPVYITGLIVSNRLQSPRSKDAILNKHINFQKKITLNYKQSTISLEFTALNYTNPNKNQYAYKLEGFDRNWHNIGNKHDVTYTNLDPGKYLFRVRGSNNDGIWNMKGASLQIIITPPFWKTYWFYGLEILLLLSIVYLYVIIRERNLIRDKRDLQEKIRDRTMQIEMQKEELEQHRNHLEQLIVDRTEELITAKEKAEESDRLKSAFLANMSHEIRTPMNAIVGFSSLLEDPHITPEERNEYISLINSNAETLLILIEDILDLSLIEANQIIIRNDVFEINELLDRIISSFAVSNKKMQVSIKLKNTLKEQNLKINTDQFRTRQILSNLMNNAYKFTDQGSIELGCVTEDSNLIFYVRDTGTGIAEKDISKIFDRFHKLDKGINNAYRGAGLGLAISKRLAELMHGNIWLTSELGKGSTFYFSLPFEKVLTHDEKPKRKANLDTNVNWESKNILIVEDEKTNYLYLHHLLKKTNATIDWAPNGLVAVKMCATKKKYDVILMDIKMPKMNGYEAAEKIRQQRPDQLIIAQTAYSRPEDEYNLRKAGFADYISKPIKPENLFSLIYKYINAEIQ